MATPMRTRKYTRAATTDTKSGKLASNFGELLENDFLHVLPNFEGWQVIYQTVGDALIIQPACWL